MKRSLNPFCKNKPILEYKEYERVETTESKSGTIYITNKTLIGGLSSVRQSSATERYLKLMKNAINFSLVALFVLRITINLLPNISRSKSNQTMKFGQLIEYNTRNIFLEKSYMKCDKESISRPFSKRSGSSLSASFSA